MTEDSNEDLQINSELESGMSPVGQADPAIVGESCSSACKVHWPLCFLSIAIVAGGLGLYGLLEFVPEVTNIVPDSVLNLVGFESGHHCSLMDNSIAAPPVVDRGMPVEAFSGITACALCEHGVSPLHEARSKGMAIVLDDGRIAVVENAHNFYPEAYRVREKHLREKNVICVHPESLELDSAELEASDPSSK